MATSRLSEHVAGTSALPLTADIRAPKSAFALISSALPPGTDLPGGVPGAVADGPVVALGGRVTVTGPLDGATISAPYRVLSAIARSLLIDQVKTR